jgi:hypothetical protein
MMPGVAFRLIVLACLAAFLDDPEAFAALEDNLDLRQFMANRDEEAPRVAPHIFVLAKGQPDLQRAVSVRALAEVPVELFAGIKQVRFRDLGDPLVDLPVERLVLRQSLLTRIHAKDP